MTTNVKVASLTVLAALAVSALPAYAQVQPRTSEVQVYVGDLIGDDLTDTAISGQTPELDDDITYGIRYGYNITQNWGVELSLGLTPTEVTNLSTADIDVDVTTLDLDAVYHFSTGNRFVPYLLAGVGYANADLDRPITGLAGGQQVSIRDDSGFTLNAGLGAKYFATDRLSIWAEGRYRYVDGLVDAFDDSLDTFEPRIGIGYAF
jgi:outer membrane beta-barrel protein